MTQRDYVANETPVPESTLTELFFEGVDRYHGEAALQSFASADRVVDISYDEVLETVQKVSAALGGRGVERGDRVAILSENRPEWALADYACLCSGMIVVPVYPSLPASQVAYVLGDSEARLVFVSDAQQARKVKEASGELPEAPTVVTFDSTSVTDTVPWELFLDVEPEVHAEAFRENALRAGPDDIATVLYTSGTTGHPKGVMLTHNNVASNVRAVHMILPIGATDNTVSFLPLSHILQRMSDYLFFWGGCTIGYPRSLDTLIVDMKKLAPTVVVSVPRIYEKIYNGIMDVGRLKKKLIQWAMGVADRVADLRLRGERPTGLLAVRYSIADKLVFSKVKKAVGGRLRFFVSGGGPLAPELNRFFYSIGLTILEGYGLTETSPVTNVNTVEDFRIGTVGKPVPGTEIRIAKDGEILIRGPQVMKGYYQAPELTATAIDEGGWFATGDIGAIDADGFLSVTDRKKDIIVTAGGKNVAPQPMENRLKTHELVEQAVVVGDLRKHPSLLVVPAFGPLEAWARSQGLSWSSREELIRHPAVVAHMESELFGMLDDFASYERPKKLALLADEFTVENGLLTPTLKVKRRVVHDELDAVIDRLYAEEAVDATDA